MKKHRKISLYIMAVLYVWAGIYHFISPGFYKKIMPPWLSLPYTLIYISGACEIVFGLLLIPKQTRPLAAWRRRQSMSPMRLKTESWSDMRNYCRLRLWLEDERHARCGFIA